MQIKNLLTVSFATALTRILGFLRDMAIAAVMGSDHAADAFILAFRLPNLARRIFSEGAFNAGFIPLYERIRKKRGRPEALHYTGEVISAFMSVVLILSLFVMGALPWFLPYFVPGIDPLSEKYAMTLLLTRLSFPFLIFTALAAIYSALLNAEEHFTAAAFAPLILNICLVGVLFTIKSDNLGIWLALTVSLSGALQAIFLFFALKRAKLNTHLNRPRMTPRIKKAFMLALPGLVAGGLAQLNVLVGTIIATLEPSAVARLYYADRLYQLPLSVIAVTLGILLLKDMISSTNIKITHNRALEGALALGIPAAVGLYMLAETIIVLLFQRGAFTTLDTFETAKALKAYAWGLPFYVIIKVSSNVFFAKEDTKTPMLIGLFGLIINIFAAIFLMNYLGASGVAHATSIAGAVTALLMMIVLSRRQGFSVDKLLLIRVFKIIIAAFCMIITFFIFNIPLLIIIALAMIFYVTTLFALKTFDLDELLSKWNGRKR